MDTLWYTGHMAAKKKRPPKYTSLAELKNGLETITTEQELMVLIEKTGPPTWAKYIRLTYSRIKRLVGPHAALYATLVCFRRALNELTDD